MVLLSTYFLTSITKRRNRRRSAGSHEKTQNTFCNQFQQIWAQMKPYEILRLLICISHLSVLGWQRFSTLKCSQNRKWLRFKNKQSFLNSSVTRSYISKLSEKCRKMPTLVFEIKKPSLVPQDFTLDRNATYRNPVFGSKLVLG